MTIKNPYNNLPKIAFWRSGVVESSPFNITDIYKKKWKIESNWKIATAGSCFAQHISQNLIKNGYNVLDMEPPPRGLSIKLHKKYGFSMYSCRFGNIYTVHQLLQLAQEAYGNFEPFDIAWEKDGKYFDALRPAVEPDGLTAVNELYTHRKYHLSRVRKMLQTMDVFIFTMGLTEAWEHQESGTIYPIAPGIIAGKFDEKVFAFRNFKFQEIIEAFNKFQDILIKLRGEDNLPKMFLTVSPVPLTATASGNHVLSATVQSKSILRAVTGQLSSENNHIDYFPSFEIITNQNARGSFYKNNMRSVRPEGVDVVMKSFFSEHNTKKIDSMAANLQVIQTDETDNIQCEEALLEAFRT